MAEKKSTAKKSSASRKTTAPRRGSGQAPATAAKKSAAKTTSSQAPAQAAIATASGSLLKLGALKPAQGSWPKRQRIGRGHGSGMVKTGGEGGKGQTVRSGGGKGPAFEGGQTPWPRRLPHKRGYSQKARDIGHFRARYAVVNLHQLSAWDPSVEVSPESLKERGVLKSARDGVKILGGSRAGKSLPAGLKFRDVVFSASALEALRVAGATVPEAAASEIT
jgi:large subunit ribosomal protein L15